MVMVVKFGEDSVDWKFVTLYWFVAFVGLDICQLADLLNPIFSPEKKPLTFNLVSKYVFYVSLPSFWRSIVCKTLLRI